MEVIDIPKIHERILKFLLKWRKRHPGFTFTLRKSDFSHRLVKGYWFHGNEEYIALSFWSGMDWQSKVPNISFIIILKTGECHLQFSAKDSPEKDDIIKSLFFRKYLLHEDSRAFYSIQLEKVLNGNYLKCLEGFLQVEKLEIDQLIKNNRKLFETKQNPKNRAGFISDEEFQKNLKRTERYRTRRVTNFVPVSLSSIEIENFGLIKRIELEDIPENVQWIFLTGENGTGKTTILRALSTAFMGGASSSRQFNEKYTSSRTKLTLHRNGKRSSYTIKRRHLSKANDPIPLTHGFVAFGPIRLNIQEDVFSFKDMPPGKKIRLDNIFNKPDIQLFSTTDRPVDIGYVYNRNQETSKELKGNEEKLKFIMEAISTICDSIVDIRFGKGMRYFETDRNQKMINEEGGSRFQDLASGYKSIIAMISHMMLHLYYQQPKINDPSELEGIVIIDEIDLHLHPKMQRDLVIKLSEIFPRIQFIASTHSPIPLLGAPANSIIFTCKIEAEKGVYLERMDHKVMFNHILPNAILSSPIFGLDNLIPEDFDSNIPLNTEDNFEEIAFNKKVRKEISDYVTDKKEKEFIKLFSSKK